LKTADKTRASDDRAERQLDTFIAKFDRKYRAVIRATRRALRRRLRGANELVYDNYNFFVIGYSPTERPSDCLVSIAAVQTAWACLSIVARRCPTHRSSSSAAAGRTVSFASTQPPGWRIPRWRR
jgi:hypothetical protein